MTAPLLRAALRYAANGLTVFPAPPGSKKSYKSAKHSGGRLWGATADADEIRRDWLRWPDANVGLPTGSINGIVVVEIDTPEGHGVDGPASLAKLQEEFSPLPETLRAASPSGSVHHYFQHPGDGTKIKNSASELGPGVDVRGDGGMVIAPPSLKPDGRTYQWLDKRPMMPMPPWLIGMTRVRPQQPRPWPSKHPTIPVSPQVVGGKEHDYGTAALKREIEALVNAALGRRNASLNSASFNLHQLVAGGELDGAEVERRLIEAASANGLVADDGMHCVLATIRSGARAGLQNPRSRR